jgi:hypothetical protein
MSSLDNNNNNNNNNYNRSSSNNDNDRIIKKKATASTVCIVILLLTCTPILTVVADRDIPSDFFKQRPIMKTRRNIWQRLKGQRDEVGKQIRGGQEVHTSGGIQIRSKISTNKSYIILIRLLVITNELLNFRHNILKLNGVPLNTSNKMYEKRIGGKFLKVRYLVAASSTAYLAQHMKNKYHIYIVQRHR